MREAPAVASGSCAGGLVGSWSREPHAAWSTACGPGRPARRHATRCRSPCVRGTVQFKAGRARRTPGFQLRTRFAARRCLPGFLDEYQLRLRAQRTLGASPWRTMVATAKAILLCAPVQSIRSLQLKAAVCILKRWIASLRSRHVRGTVWVLADLAAGIERGATGAAASTSLRRSTYLNCSVRWDLCQAPSFALVSSALWTRDRNAAFLQLLLI
mmetsp:Transcript_30601/g.79375  ORF Transcript_30601/g.79375 Transcript_30601/m.79375 type:complete len:214 (+) Transcript_30601:1162-1803(+)